MDSINIQYGIQQYNISIDLCADDVQMIVLFDSSDMNCRVAKSREVSRWH